MQDVVLFFMSFIFIFVIYEIFIVSRAKKNERKKKDSKQPVEVKYLITRYKFDLKKLDYHKLLHVCALVSSLDMALIVSVSALVDSYMLQLIIVLLLVIPVILISYHCVYLIYKKKGMI